MLTPEQAQNLTDLRSRMLTNIENGRPSHEGISEEELSLALSAVRGSRAAAAAAGGTAKGEGKGRKKKADPLATPSVSVTANPKFSKFSKYNLD